MTPNKLSWHSFEEQANYHNIFSKPEYIAIIKGISDFQEDNYKPTTSELHEHITTVYSTPITYDKTYYHVNRLISQNIVYQTPQKELYLKNEYYVGKSVPPTLFTIYGTAILFSSLSLIFSTFTPTHPFIPKISIIIILYTVALLLITYYDLELSLTDFKTKLSTIVKEKNLHNPTKNN